MIILCKKVEIFFIDQIFALCYSLQKNNATRLTVTEIQFCVKRNIQFISWPFLPSILIICLLPSPPSLPRGNCDQAFVEVRDGGTLLSPLLARFCGRNLPETQHTTGDVLFVRYFNNLTQHHAGFKAMASIGMFDFCFQLLHTVYLLLYIGKP